MGEVKDVVVTTESGDGGKISMPDRGPDFVKSEERRQPRKSVFGAIEVIEDLDRDLLVNGERRVYNFGFRALREMVSRADGNVERMVFTTPDIVSGIVGLQPLVTLSRGEALFIYRFLNASTSELADNYTFMRIGDDLELMVNKASAELVLRRYQDILDIDLPEGQLSVDRLLEIIKGLLNHHDVKKANFAHGLLSGFPKEDCEFFVNTARLAPIPKIERSWLFSLKEPRKINAMRLLNLADHLMSNTKNYFLPDTRSEISVDAASGMIEGFGLRWVAALPAEKATVRHCQRLLQVDRELGLLEYVGAQRKGLSVGDCIKAIKLSKLLGPMGSVLSLSERIKLSEKRSGASLTVPLAS